MFANCITNLHVLIAFVVGRGNSWKIIKWKM